MIFMVAGSTRMRARVVPEATQTEPPPVAISGDQSVEAWIALG